MRKATATGLLTAAVGAAGARFALRSARQAIERQATERQATERQATERSGNVGGRSRLAALLEPDCWNRTNHRGEPVTLLEGPAFAAGAAAAVLFAPGISGRVRVAGTAAALGAGALGAYDDLHGNADRRGLRGHINALRNGEVTTGGVKLVGIGALGLACAALVRRGSIVDQALAGIVVAGAANAVNLLDLRPGRAVKAAALASAPGLARRTFRADGDRAAVALGAAGLGAAAALLPEDLGERAMLGDAGANALGAVLGLAAAAGASRAGLVWRAAALTAVTLASEKVSFTRVIAGCAPLDALDRLGRRPTTAAKVPAQTVRGVQAAAQAAVQAAPEAGAGRAAHRDAAGADSVSSGADSAGPDSASSSTDFVDSDSADSGAIDSGPADSDSVDPPRDPDTRG